MNLAVLDMDFVMENMDFVVDDIDFNVKGNSLVENNNFFVVENNLLFWYIVDKHHVLNIIFLEDLVLILVYHLYF